MDDGPQQDPVLLASVDFLTLEYHDEQLPLNSTLQYYVSTIKDGKELKSMTVETQGAAALYILPYQMKLLPEKNLAIIRSTSDIYLLDYEKQVIVGRKTFPGKIGSIEMAVNSGKNELYVPCSDNNVYICDPYNLDVLETLVTNAPVASVAVNSNGLIFLSGEDFSWPLKIFKREPLSFVAQFSGDVNAGLELISETQLVSISTTISPANMSVYSFTDEGGLLSNQFGPVGHDYEMDGNRMKANGRYVVTSTMGEVYSVNNGISYIGAISTTTNLTDFDFSETGNIIYSAATDRRQVIRTSVENGELSFSTLNTKSFPWIIARSGSRLIILSSPTAFTPYTLTGRIVIEKIPL